jgi:hypothetical protein
VAGPNRLKAGRPDMIALENTFHSGVAIVG